MVIIILYYLIALITDLTLITDLIPDSIPDIYNLDDFNRTKEYRDVLDILLIDTLNKPVSVSYGNYETRTIGRDLLIYDTDNNIIGAKLFPHKYDMNELLIYTSHKITINIIDNLESRRICIEPRNNIIISVNYNAYIELPKSEILICIKFYKLSNIHSITNKIGTVINYKHNIRIFDEAYVKYFINVNRNDNFSKEMFSLSDTFENIKYINDIYLPIFNNELSGKVKIKRFKICTHNNKIMYMIEYIKLFRFNESILGINDIYIIINKFKNNKYMYTYNNIKQYNFNESIYIDTSRLNNNNDNYYVIY